MESHGTRTGSRSATQRTGALVALALWLVVLPCRSPAATVLLKEIPPVKAPVVKNNRITYTINLVFNNCPEEYWVYYDQNQSSLTIDVYGYHVRTEPLSITGTSLLGDPEVKNLNTRMSLGGQQAQVRIPLEPGWHVESSTTDGQIMELKLWKDLKARELVSRPRKSPVVLYLMTLAGVGTATFLLILFTNIDTNS